MKAVNNCSKCGAGAVCLHPSDFNNLSGHQVHCMAKSCNNNQTKQYRYKGVAIRYWNEKNLGDQGDEHYD